MISGILNIKKEPGFTSHDVVAKLRGIVHQKKIGHTGTLDPDATGVLPVCLGKATKLCDIIGDWDKTYEAVLLLGRETDTEDTSGQTLKEREVTVTEEEIRDIILSFQGSYDQIPPMYSAKKVNGKKLYELARQGIVIERKPCPVTLSSIIIKKIDLPYVTFEVTCSKGTYIRSLCRDIGEKAGCGGCMAGLVRTRVSSFKIEDGFTLSEVEAMRDADTLLEHIVPVDEVFLHLPAFFPAALVLSCPDQSAPVLFESVPGHHLTGLLFRPAAQDLRLSVPQSFPAVSWLQPAAVLVLSILFLTAGSVQ